MRRTAVVIADSTPIFRSAVSALLTNQPDFSVSEAADLDELISVAGQTPAEIVLLDADLPPAGGLEAIERLSEVCDASIVVWSLTPQPEDVLAAIRAGARGYLSKASAPTAFVDALRGTRQNEAPLTPQLAAALIDGIHADARRARARERAGLLSGRELQVLGLIAAGLQTREIADTLVISHFTVNRHVQNILEKLDLHSREAAAALFRSAFADEPSRNGRESADGAAAWATATFRSIVDARGERV